MVDFKKKAREARDKAKEADSVPTPAPPPETKSKLVWADLPLVSTLPPGDMREAKELLEELDSVQELKSTYEDREEEIKLELQRLQNEYNLMGLRWGDFAFAATSNKGKKTLDKTLLIQYGVSAEVIKACIKTGNPYVKKEFRNLKKKQKREEE